MGTTAPRATSERPLPLISPMLLAAFRLYARRYVRGHLHAVRLLRSSPGPGDAPVVAPASRRQQVASRHGSPEPDDAPIVAPASRRQQVGLQSGSPDPDDAPIVAPASRRQQVGLQSGSPDPDDAPIVAPASRRQQVGLQSGSRDPGDAPVVAPASRRQQVRLLLDTPEPGDGPMLLYLNHPSWWDPLVCMVVADRLLPGRRAYAPIDAAALAKYRFFGRLGFFGVEQDALAGARTFLRTGAAILNDPGAALWVTPQGRFADPRERPISVERGIAELALRVPGTTCVPIAIEYPFWEERTPEALVAVGEPVRVGAMDEPPLHRRSASEARSLTSQLSGRLEATMDRLTEASLRRSVGDFETVLSGSAGVGGVYDAWRAFIARLTGRAFDPGHGGG
ncbi:MAG: hypothetical protein FJX72_10010 [Armatimonadetes bacterium]|nr:hypothetical protein [Armatimonadota bacterium]